MMHAPQRSHRVRPPDDAGAPHRAPRPPRSAPPHKKPRGETAAYESLRAAPAPTFREPQLHHPPGATSSQSHERPRARHPHASTALPPPASLSHSHSASQTHSNPHHVFSMTPNAATGSTGLSGRTTAGTAATTITGASSTSPTNAHNANTTMGERKSSFSVAGWIREPLAEAAADVLLKQTTVWHAVEQIVARTPDATAVCAHDPATDDTQALSWRELYEQALAMVNVLVHLGLGVGDGVVFCTKSSQALYVLHFATIAAGGVVSHIRPNWKAEELARGVFPNAKAKILVVDKLTDNFVRAIRDTVPSHDGSESIRPHDVRAVVALRGFSTERALALDLPVSLLTLDDMRTLARECAATQLQLLDRTTGAGVMPTDPCVLSFDYDAAGHVRGTCLSHDNVMFAAANLARSFGPLSFLDRLVAYLPLHHVASLVIELFMPLLSGVTVYCAPSYKLGPLINVIKRCRPTIFFATPDIWTHISLQVYKAKREVNSFLYRWAKARATNNSKKLRFGHDAHRSLGYMLAKKLVLNNLKKRIGLESCHACYSVLAPLDFELEKLFKTIDIPIYQLYGVPESSGFAAINFPHSWEFGTCGRALQGTVMEYDDISHELLLRGRHVFLGYVRYHGQIVPSQTSDGWLRVPQQGHLTPDGFLKINDPPRHFLVLSTGEWVPTEPYERALRDQPELERAVLVGDGRTFLSVLLFMKTVATQTSSMGPYGVPLSGLGSIMGAIASRGTSFSSGASYMLTNKTGNAVAGSRQAHYVLCDDAIQLGQSMGSHATTVAEVIQCQRWAVHFDRVIDGLPRRVGVSGVQVRKWIVMADEFTVEGGELDPDTGEVKRRAVDTKYHTLLDSLYC